MLNESGRIEAKKKRKKGEGRDKKGMKRKMDTPKAYLSIRLSNRRNEEREREKEGRHEMELITDQE